MLIYKAVRLYKMSRSSQSLRKISLRGLQNQSRWVISEKVAEALDDEETNGDWSVAAGFFQPHLNYLLRLQTAKFKSLMQVSLLL